VSSVRVVVATLDGAQTLPALLTACASQDFAEPFEVVVVDDGSTDGTAVVAERMGATVVRQENRGPASARNAGWKREGADWILFTDSDCVPRRDWVRLLVSALRDGASVVAGSYGIANPGNWLAEAIHAEIVWRHARLRDTIDFAGSFNLGARREALEAVGGFDESFAAPSAEDNDLSYRWGRAGYSIRFVRTALVDHRHPTSLRRYLREQERHGYWRVRLYRSHPTRIRGDGYAGAIDFAPPVLAVGSIVALPFLVFGTNALGVAALCFAMIVILQNVLAFRVASHTRSSAALALVGVGTLRAYARGWGLVRGIVRSLSRGGSR
jgi:glycosyltransferase involved in cell wall biosynthesis